MQASTLGSAPTDTALLISQEGVTFGQFGHRIIHPSGNSNPQQEGKKRIQNWQFWRGLQSPTPAWALGALCWTGHEPWEGKGRSLHSSCTWTLVANHPQMGVTRLSTPHYSLLAMTFHSRPCLDTVHEHQDCHAMEGGYVFLHALSCGKTFSLSVNFMQNPQMTDKTKFKVCIFFRNPNKTSYGY